MYWTQIRAEAFLQVVSGLAILRKNGLSPQTMLRQTNYDPKMEQYLNGKAKTMLPELNAMQQDGRNVAVQRNGQGTTVQRKTGDGPANKVGKEDEEIEEHTNGKRF